MSRSADVRGRNLCEMYQLLGHMKYYHALASERFAVAHFITYGANFPHFSMPYTNNSQK